MKNPKSSQTTAAIDVGSNYLRMSIANINNNGHINVLEDLIKPTNIGRDTFSSGRISVETIHQTCEDIKGFTLVMKDYKIKNYKAVCTSGIREAQNKQYILEQIKLRTGIDVEDINVSQERFYIMKALKYHISKFDFFNGKTTLVINITTGSVEASIFENNKLKFTEHIKIGSLRLKETLGELENKALDFSDLMEEYVESKLYWIKYNIKNLKIQNLIIIGGEIHTIISLINNKNSNIKIKNLILGKDFKLLYNEIKNMTKNQINLKYNTGIKKIELLLPTMLIFNCFLKIAGTENIYNPNITLRLGILHDLTDKIFDLPRKSQLTDDILSSIDHIVNKYKIDKKHSHYVEKIALSIFDQTLRIHKLGDEEKLYLQISSRLHDIGQFIDTVTPEIQSYNIIMSQDIMGFSHRKLNIIASIAKYHWDIIPQEDDPNYFALSSKDKMITSMLSAILKIAEALDISHLQKIPDIKLTKNNNMLFFNITSREDISIEEWAFNNKVNFFEEVFGIRPII